MQAIVDDKRGVCRPIDHETPTQHASLAATMQRNTRKTRAAPRKFRHCRPLVTSHPVWSSARCGAFLIGRTQGEKDPTAISI